MLLQQSGRDYQLVSLPSSSKASTKGTGAFQSYLVKDANASTVATRQSPRKGKKKASSSISLARRTLDDSIHLRPLSDSEDLFETVDIEFDNIRLEQKVQELEEEMKALKEQLDIQQDIVKQLKRVVFFSTPSQEAPVAGEEEVSRIEQTQAFQHLRNKPSDVGAMLACSVKGKKSRGKEKTGTMKPPLNPRGVNATVTCVLNKFQKTGDRAPALVTAMGTRLSELRSDVGSIQPDVDVVDDEEETQLFLVAETEESRVSRMMGNLKDSGFQVTYPFFFIFLNLPSTFA
ncbi:hypothetical protein BSL78_04018 [Apostichopus japonicus]|uniref:Uncharacterized protein n=1 Tax=Stichopus japonicus TaxID=307972 RepID=A0A2G8LFP3_STIJA|nr:hypothetical protein BSL78_04018 [Apostichopus japonicus]